MRISIKTGAVALSAIFGISSIALRTMAACNAPNGRSVTFLVHGLKVVNVGSIVSYTMETLYPTYTSDEINNSTYTWTHDSFDFPTISANTINLKAPATPSTGLYDKLIKCEFSNPSWPSTSTCEAQQSVTVIDPTITSPINNLIYLTSQQVGLAGSLGNTTLNNKLLWGLTSDEELLLAGSGTSLSTTLSGAGEIRLSMLFGDTVETAVATTANRLLYVWNGTSGKASDIFTLGIADWTKSDSDAADMIAQWLIGQAEELNAEKLEEYPEARSLNQGLLSATEEDLSAGILSSMNDAWNHDLVGKTVIEASSLFGTSSGFLDHLDFEFGVGLDVDWIKVIKDGDYSDAELEMDSGIKWHLHHSTIELGAETLWVPHESNPESTLIMLHWVAEPGWWN